ncbi:RNA-directed DNA polymerase [Paraburkholderia sp. BL6669N2]|uniref:reverse transcriptase family protein n=1 Tax=Paraburkholderia sp. BL6669N2 TaxID=1938807 RepID=UPI000E267931|nr:reverse transcriptase family protein [Paraburkholderia sp. BL6669N2]REG49003.1 RNA-directed DNA polymerase [Paraburkholderia sp. BL6669N2]
MGNWRPQHYRTIGSEKGVPRDVLDAAVQTGKAIVRTDAQLEPVFTLRHLAYLTDCDYGLLRAIVGRSIQNPYRVFRVHKRPGPDGQKRYRTICAPDPQLLTVQRWLSTNVLNHASSSIHAASTAFAPGCTLLNAAEPHCGARWLIKVDVQNFFESISEIAAYRAFRGLGYQPLVAFEFARLCTRLGRKTSRRSHAQWRRAPWRRYKIAAYNHDQYRIGHLPQGAPTSPMLANIAMHGADEALHALARSSGLTYTRYADDLTFSTTALDFNRELASIVVRSVYRILGEYGFSPNVAKTQIIPPRARKIVLGLLVDEPNPRLPREFREKMRMHLYYIKKDGVGPARHAANRGFTAVASLRNVLYGLAAFATQIEPQYGLSIRKELDAVAWPT